MNITYLFFIYSVLLLANGRYNSRNDGIDRLYPENLKDVNIPSVAKAIDGVDTAKVWFNKFVQKFREFIKLKSVYIEAKPNKANYYFIEEQVLNTSFK